MREHLQQVYEIECKDKGNAFLTDRDLLITVKHVVVASRMKDLSHPYKIMLNPGDGGKKIECKILEHDEDKFENSTLVLLEPQEQLPRHTQRAKKTIVEKPISEITGYIGGKFEEFTIGEAKPVVLQNIETDEKINTGITIEKLPATCMTLSGSPVVRGDNIYGVLIAETNDVENKTFKLCALCDQGFWDQVGKLRKKLQEKQEAQQKVSQPILTFAEYVAQACDDRPHGLRLLEDPSAYSNKYIDSNIDEKQIEDHQSKLKEFVLQIHNAGREIDTVSARRIRDNALKILCELYSDPKHILDVYISALYSVLHLAYQERESRPELMKAAKNLLEVAAEGLPNDFPHRHLFIAEYYVAVASDLNQKAWEAVKEARHLCDLKRMNTKCDANICALSTCGRAKEGYADVTGTLENHKVAAEGFPNDFPHRYLFMAEYYVAAASDMEQKAKKAIEEAKHLCEPEWMNTNCYANICILSTCCRTAEGMEMGDADVWSALQAAISNRPEDCEFYLCNTGAHRMMSYYYAHTDDFFAAVKCVQYAFELDSRANSEKGCKDDHTCFESICYKALKTYGQKGFGNYSDWYKFRTYAAGSPLYESISCDEFEVQENKTWISALREWNRNRNGTSLQSTEVLEYEYSDTLLLKEFFEKCERKALLLKVTDFKRMDTEDFETLRKQYDSKFSMILGEAVYDCQLDSDAYLYIYKYRPDGERTLPVWHLICRK